MSSREGGLEAPDRQPLDWKNPDFYDRDSLHAEMERVFDVCHSCRRCVSLCDSFPTLFDLIGESDTFEVDGVDKADYNKVVEQCFLCDLCAETKCPYVPPHEWAIDFPHLMLRGKAQNFANKDTKWRDRIITSTDPIFDAISTPGIAQLANAAAGSQTLRKAGEALLAAFIRMHPCRILKAPLRVSASPPPANPKRNPLRPTAPPARLPYMLPATGTTTSRKWSKT